MDRILSEKRFKRHFTNTTPSTKILGLDFHTHITTQNQLELRVVNHSLCRIRRSTLNWVKTTGKLFERAFHNCVPLGWLHNDCVTHALEFRQFRGSSTDLGAFLGNRRKGDNTLVFTHNLVDERSKHGFAVTTLTQIHMESLLVGRTK